MPFLYEAISWANLPAGFDPLSSLREDGLGSVFEETHIRNDNATTSKSGSIDLGSIYGQRGMMGGGCKSVSIDLLAYG